MISNELIEQTENGGGFDLWRKEFRNLTFEERKRVCNAWGVAYPVQRYCNLPFFTACFAMIESEYVDLRKTRIVEFGADDGWLAYHMMTEFGITAWEGYDLSPVRMGNTVKEATELGYHCTELHTDFWNTEVGKYDIFVSAHTIEHLTDEQCSALLDSIPRSAKYLLLEICTLGARKSWDHYRGSHILNYRDEDLDRMIQDKGFDLIPVSAPKPEYARLFGRG